MWIAVPLPAQQYRRQLMKLHFKKVGKKSDSQSFEKEEKSRTPSSASESLTSTYEQLIEDEYGKRQNMGRREEALIFQRGVALRERGNPRRHLLSKPQ